MKFGKHIQRRQLEIPEYSAAFVNYKGLKKLIKQLSATPILAAQNAPQVHPESLDPRAALQQNRASFFFRLERELEKVNRCYLQKEGEMNLRLKMLIDKKKAIQNKNSVAPMQSANLRNLLQGFQQFNDDLSKLQQYIEVNQTAFAKILKKWDKTAKSKTKELYLSRAVEVQPCFNQEVLSRLSDQATTNRLEIEAWAEGERIQFDTNGDPHILMGQVVGSEDSETENELLHALNTGNSEALRGWIARLKDSADGRTKLTRTFLSGIESAPIQSLDLLVSSQAIDLRAKDEINLRNCLHEAAIAGREDILTFGVQAAVSVAERDVYGKSPLHYACMHGHVNMMVQLLEQDPTTIDDLDHDKFTPLVHAIVNRSLECVQLLLKAGARIEPQGDNDHIPLNLACQSGDQYIVQMLLERNASVLADAEGLYPQHLVAGSGHSPEILLLLEEHGADLDQRDKLYQWTPLFHAASEGCVNMLKVLLDKNVDVGAEDEKGLPAIYYAVWEGHLECMQLLASAALRKPPTKGPKIQRLPPQEMTSSMPQPMSIEPDGIPALELPPPIIPLRRYGHNFLDSKAFIQINFEPGPAKGGANGVMFYHDSKYPAARLTISSKSSDLIPRNVALPIQDEDSRRMSFQVDNLSAFTLEFDIFPTFGAKRIAHGVALPDVFSALESSKGNCVVPLFDPRLRVIGRIAFRFQVLKPCTFPGAPIELAGAGPMETYWKATTQDSHQPDSLVIGSSLSGDYVQLHVQLTADGIPVLYPRWGVAESHPANHPVCRLSLDEFQSLAPNHRSEVKKQISLALEARGGSHDHSGLHVVLARSHLTLADALAQLPQSVNVALHVIYPSKDEERRIGFGRALNINDFADAILRVVFEHAQSSRNTDLDNKAGFVRSIVFASWNPDICTALNWKQPNYPVLLCNDLGTDAADDDDAKMSGTAGSGSSTCALVKSDGRLSISVKDAVRIAQGNNFMGLVCTSKLLKAVPALTQSIKVAGLVLVSDTTFDTEYAQQRSFAMPSGVDGILKGNGVLRFNNTIDM